MFKGVSDKMYQDEKIGLVKEIRGDKLLISLSCVTRCAGCGICTSGNTAGNIIETENSINASPGDKVIVRQHAWTSLYISLIIYGLPLLFFILGISAGFYLFGSSIAGFFSGITGLISSFPAVKFLSKRVSCGIRIIKLKEES